MRGETVRKSIGFPSFRILPPGKIKVFPGKIRKLKKVRRDFFDK